MITWKPTKLISEAHTANIRKPFSLEYTNI
jgi:hypothetical protein